MAWIEQRRRADGGLTARVIWRLGGGRDAVRASETFASAQLLRTWLVRTASSGWSRPEVSGGPTVG